MEEIGKPSLFGIKHSNRDFADRDSWGKNIFNSAFPAALLAYLESKNLECVYIKFNTDFNTIHTMISVEDLFGLSPNDEKLFYNFESFYSEYSKFLVNDKKTPRIDLIVESRSEDKKVQLKAFEIKLTVLPDNATFKLEKDKYGCEIVIRHDTITYLACSLFKVYENRKHKLNKILGNKVIDDASWSNEGKLEEHLSEITRVINEISIDCIDEQIPLLIQPIWKTIGKSFALEDNCLDVFIWSNLALLRLFATYINEGENNNPISEITLEHKTKKKAKPKKPKQDRKFRTLVWFYKMLRDFSSNKLVNPDKLFNEFTSNQKTDKSLSVTGNITRDFMQCDILKKPRIKKDEIRNIILGGGQNLLSPERRFDAVVFRSDELF